MQITLPSGNKYDQLGTLDYSSVIVNPNTGAINMRAQAPNPQQRLLSGMYVTLTVNMGELNKVFLIPQAAIQRDPAGAYALVVGKDGNVAQKRVAADSMHGNDWLVTSGLDAGDQVIVSGIQTVKPGAPARRAHGHLTKHQPVKALPPWPSVRRALMPSFFIDRPIFAWVVAILITLVGTISVLNMGVESYPNIAPPQVTVTATFPGCQRQTMEDTVTKVIEQQLTGVDNLLYSQFGFELNGTSTITLSFATGTDPGTSPRCRCRTRCRWRSRSCRPP